MRWLGAAARAAIAALILAGCSDRASDGAQDQSELNAAADTPVRAFDPLGLGAAHTCTLARRGVACWGSSSDGQTTVPALRHPSSVTAGLSHTCALDDDGVKCWGDNTDGQTRVPTLRHPIQVSAGQNHACAVDDDGVKCWGANGAMQTTVPALRKPTQVSGGNSHTCAIDADGVKCWGSDASGQTTVPALRQPVQVRAGGSHTCALDADGVKCWGFNQNGQTTVPALRDPKQISVGANHSCALTADGVKCWGLNSFMQIDVPPLRRPTQIRSGRSFNCALDDDSDIVCWGANLSGQTTIPADVQLLGNHVCMPFAGGVRCAGDNEHGQLGVANDQDQVIALTAAGVTNLGQAFGAPSHVGIGHSFGCALNGTGVVKCWGYNARGQLGLGDKRDRGTGQGEMGDALPALQFAGGGPITKIDVGDDHACALTGGQLFCWGKGSAGQLGTEATDDASTAVKPRLKAGLAVRDFSLGHSHTCVLTRDGAVYCFGDNGVGQLGIGSPGAVGDRPGTMGDAMKPVALGDGFKAKSIASGARHVCALSTDGRVKCWGAAESGQLGSGDTKNRGTSPEDMGGALPAVDLGHGQAVKAIACGAQHCCATMVQNTMKCWGSNSEGQLGLGDVEVRGTDPSSMGDALPFLQTLPHETILSIQLEGDRTCARSESGVRCWGRNKSGELGYGDRDARGGSFSTIPRLLPPVGM
jgi:alpha-tubulin suppressor-like RCC1 family protein